MATLFNTKIKDTYQSLLKLEDNTILTTTSKNITDGLGNASPLYMSTTQVRIGSTSASALYWDNVNNRLGIGIDSPIYNLQVNSTGTNILAISSNSSNNNSTELRFVTNNGTWSSQIRNWQTSGGANQGLYIQSGGIFTGGSINAVFNISGNTFFGNTLTPATARVHVQGSGSTGATSSLLVQNSAGVTALEIFDSLTVRSDNSNLFFSNTTAQHRLGLMTFTNNSISCLSVLNIGGNTATTFTNATLSFQTSTTFNALGAPNNATRSGISIVGDFTNPGAGIISIGNNFNITTALNTSVGTVTLNQFNITNTVNTTGGTTLQRGFYYNPTLTSTTGFTHRAIETTTGDVLLGTTSGNVGIGTSNPTEKLDIVGNIKSLGTLNISIPAVNTLANGSIIAAPSQHGRPYAVDFTIGAYTLTTQDNQLTIGPRNSGVMFIGSQMYTYGIPTQIWGTSTGPNNCSSLHIGVNSTSEYQTGTAYPSTSDNYFYLSTVIVAPNGSIYSPTRPTPTRRKFIFSALELLFHTGNSGVESGRIFSNGNWAINTTTDSGYKLDVNGTARVTNLRSGSFYAASPLDVGIAGTGFMATFQYGAVAGGGSLFFVRAGFAAGGITSSRYEDYDLVLGAGNFGSTLGIAIRPANVGGVKIGGDNTTVTHVDSAILNVESTTKGVLFPRMTTAQKLAITSPVGGLQVFDTTLNQMSYYNGTAWINF
jgi:hypothetical protein